MTETLTTEQVEAIVEWQDISTAPMDGTEILGFFGPAEAYGVVWYEAGDWHEYDVDVIVRAPSHWQPLPTRPIEESARSELSL